MEDRNRNLDALVRDVWAGRISRRDVLKRAAALGLSVPAIAALVAACGGGTTSTATQAPTATTSTGGVSGSPTATTASTATASPSGSPSAGTTYTKDNPPAVANAAAAKQYSGAKLTYYGDQVGIGADLDQALSKRFTQDTGIAINVVPRPKDSSESLAQFLRTFQARSSDIDVLMLDVIWPGILAQHLVDLTQTFASEAKLHYDTIITNNTVNGKLIAIPWFGDFGMLYYRTDLLQKYNISGPPQTWDDLENQAKTIMNGERGANANFQGFVFQGSSYEGLTTNALEWLASSGGGTIMDASGKVTLNNQNAIQILNKARGWVGTIAPRGVSSYQEEDARQVFQGGNSAFMRNWPYAYALAGGSDSAVQGKFDVAPLPAAPGQDHVGTVGGWQLAISNYSKSKEAAIEFVRYLTSPEVESYRAQVGSFVPTIQSVAEEAPVAKAEPFLEKMANVTRVTRPSTVTGDKYNQVSTVFFQGVNQILNGQDAAQMVPQIAQQIERAAG